MAHLIAFGARLHNLQLVFSRCLQDDIRRLQIDTRAGVNSSSVHPGPKHQRRIIPLMIGLVWKGAL